MASIEIEFLSVICRDPQERRGDEPYFFAIPFAIQSDASKIWYNGGLSTVEKHIRKGSTYAPNLLSKNGSRRTKLTLDDEKATHIGVTTWFYEKDSGGNYEALRDSPANSIPDNGSLKPPSPAEMIDVKGFAECAKKTDTAAMAMCYVTRAVRTIAKIVKAFRKDDPIGEDNWSIALDGWPVGDEGAKDFTLTFERRRGLRDAYYEMTARATRTS